MAAREASSSEAKGTSAAASAQAGELQFTAVSLRAKVEEACGHRDESAAALAEAVAAVSACAFEMEEALKQMEEDMQANAESLAVPPLPLPPSLQPPLPLRIPLCQTPPAASASFLRPGIQFCLFGCQRMGIPLLLLKRIGTEPASRCVSCFVPSVSCFCFSSCFGHNCTSRLTAPPRAFLPASRASGIVAPKVEHTATLKSADETLAELGKAKGGLAEARRQLETSARRIKDLEAKAQELKVLLSALFPLPLRVRGLWTGHPLCCHRNRRPHWRSS